MNINAKWIDRLKADSILVTGGTGFLGRRVVQFLNDFGFKIELFSGQNAKPGVAYTISSKLIDLTSENKVSELFRMLNPSIVIHLAAVVGGIGANREKPGEFFYKNAIMGILTQEYARRTGTKKFVTVGTVCSYPKYTQVPFKETDFWVGYPEETNAPYGIAKKAILAQGQAYRQQYGFNSIHLLPANLYGPQDNFSEQTSHVIPALIKKVHHAKQHNIEFIEVWGDGTPTREFLYVDDAAIGILKATALYDNPEPLNLGTGEEISIEKLVTLIKQRMAYDGRVIYRSDYPNGQPRRSLDISMAQLFIDYKSETDLTTGLDKTIAWYVNGGYKQD